VRPDLPPGRYDPPNPRARIVTWVVAAAVSLAAVAGAWSLYSRHQAGRLEAELTAYDVRSDTLVRIRFSVVPRGHRGECKVRAKDRTGAETGARIVAVTPDGSRNQEVIVDLATRARAVNGELVGCRRLSP
jgi:hypothetical protein